MNQRPTDESDFQAELLRLRDEVQVLALANVHAAELMAELQEARALEELLKANNEQLLRAKSLETSRAQFLELVARNQPEEALISCIANMIETRLPDLAYVLLSGGEELWQCYSKGLSQDLGEGLKGIALNTAECVQKAMETRRPVTALHVGRAPHSGPVYKLLREYGWNTLVCIPVLSPVGRSLGAVCVLGQEARELDGEVQQFMDQAATLFAMGLNHRKMTDKLTYQAHHDTLTSLPNRAYFYEALHNALAATEYGGANIAILWADLDRFKQINDTLGHHGADLLLQLVAQRLQACVEGRGTVARMGGDEFAVLVREEDASGQAELLAAEILEVFREPFGFGENQCTIGMSIGISLYPEHGQDSEELVRNADLAMYSAKRSGRNTYVRFTPEKAEHSLESTRLEFHLRRALEHGELELYFQPLVSCKDGRIRAFETLLRWFCPALGAVSPAQFIPVAEAAGLMPVIGKWVLEQACLQAASWQSVAPGVRVAVNVAAAQLVRGDFRTVVEGALASSGLSSGLLELELTESAVMDAENCRVWIAEMRALGVSLAIDDFGTGYSSLSYLHNLDVDTLKVDRSFVQALGKEPAAAKLAETIIGMAKSLGLQVVAEGIETQEQLEWLTSLHCDLLQGYYLHRPMPIASVFDVLAKAPSLASIAR